MTWQGDDRRREPRVAAGFQGGLTQDGRSDLHGPETADRVSVKDISASGVCCHSDHELPEMSLVRLELLLPGEEGPLAEVPVRCAGAVVRSEPIPESTYPSWEVALYFTEISDQDRDRIRAFVERELTTRSDTPVGS